MKYTFTHYLSSKLSRIFSLFLSFLKKISQRGWIIICCIVFILVLVFSLLGNDHESTLQERYPDMGGLDLQAMEVREKAQQAAGMIQVVYPQEGDRITSPLTLSGLVKKEWMTEEGFPIELRENDGDLITTVMAKKMSDSSEDSVSFSAIMDFVVGATDTPAKIVFKNSNPGNDPDKALEYGFWVSF